MKEDGRTVESASVIRIGHARARSPAGHVDGAGPARVKQVRQPEEWLSTTDVARELGMSAKWVRTQRRAGRLCCAVYRTARRSTFRISRRALVAFLRRCRTGA